MLRELFTVCLHCGTQLPPTGRVCPRCRTPRPLGGCLQTCRIVLAAGAVVVGIGLALRDAATTWPVPAEVRRAEPVESAIGASWYALLVTHDNTTRGRGEAEADRKRCSQIVTAHGLVQPVAVFRASDGRVTVVLGAPKSEAAARALADTAARLRLSADAHAEAGSGWVRLR